MDKQQSRPPAGVPKDKVLSYLLCLYQWITNDQLAQYLKDPEQCVEANHALEDSLHADLDHETLTQWCNTWLSKERWKMGTATGFSSIQLSAPPASWKVYKLLISAGRTGLSWLVRAIQTHEKTQKGN